MRVIITGDRRWYAPNLAVQVVNRLLFRYGPDVVIVHGAVRGIDWSFTQACGELGVKVEVHPARWDHLDVPGAIVRVNKDGLRYNARAGPIRNAEMVRAGAEMCIAFHRRLGFSRGAKDCVRRAIEAGIPTYPIDSENAVPKRLRADGVRLSRAQRNAGAGG
jgi:hypothetical protein